MKKTIYIFLLVIIISCTSDDIQTTDPIIGVWNTTGSFTGDNGITSDFETTLTYSSSGSATNESIFTGDFNQDGVIETNEFSIDFTWENTSPSLDYSILSQTYNISTPNSQTGEINVTSTIWEFDEDYDTAISTQQNGQVLTWTRK